MALNAPTTREVKIMYICISQAIQMKYFSNNSKNRSFMYTFDVTIMVKYLSLCHQECRKNEMLLSKLRAKGAS